MTVAGCADVTITPGIVQFNAQEFLGMFPSFAAQAAILPVNFALATTQLNNTCGSVVQDANLRQSLLYLLTAHITKLLNGEGTQPASGVVGRVSDASQGSVSASTEYDAQGGPSQAYFIQTQYGAMFWQSTAAFRTMRYYGPCDGPSSGYFWGGGCGC